MYHVICFLCNLMCYNTSVFLSARVCGSQVPDIGGQSITGPVLLTLHDGDAVDSAFSRKLEEIFLVYILAHCACHVFLLPATGICAVGIQIVAILCHPIYPGIFRLQMAGIGG